jgi:exonuclease III
MTQSNSQVKILWLNTWANRCKEEILEYVAEQANVVDIFFFTEVTRMKWRADKVTTAQVGRSENEPPMQLNSSSQLIDALSKTHFSRYNAGKSSMFTCSDSKIDFHQVGFGSLMAFKDSLGKTFFGAAKIGKDSTTSSRVLQWVIYEKSGVRYLAAHLHGLWIKENTKGNHPDRMHQSEQVLKILERLVFKHRVSKVIFGGDLNLAPDTEALAMLLSGKKEESLSRNLIIDHGISDTRTPLYRKYHEVGTELLADYVLTSSNVEVVEFLVGSSKSVSDHAPLVATIY